MKIELSPTFRDQLHGLGYKGDDVKVLSREWGLAASEAAEKLIAASNQGFSGKTIQQKYDSENCWKELGSEDRIGRTAIAFDEFVNQFGRPESPTGLIKSH